MGNFINILVDLITHYLSVLGIILITYAIGYLTDKSNEMLIGICIFLLVVPLLRLLIIYLTKRMNRKDYIRFRIYELLSENDINGRKFK